jgi:exodeoxyribonuclease V alpha subunit
MLAAPTGRAAKRMSEATGHEAKTIHRMLEYSIQKGGFQRDEESPLKCDLLVIDEASMIDTILMHHLLKAIPKEATFILVGDVNQLPSVGAGNVLNDIISSAALPVVELNEIFRQAKQSQIIVNAHRINKGQMPKLGSFSGDTDFYFIEKEDPEDVLQIILELVDKRILQKFGFDPVDDIQVLAPMHRGTVGAGNPNIKLQETLNPGEGGLLRGTRIFRINDKVMQIKNNYDKEVFNGDIGKISRIYFENQQIGITFDGRSVDYDSSHSLRGSPPGYAYDLHVNELSEIAVGRRPRITLG